MGLAIFEDYSQSKEGTNYAPFIVNISQVLCYDKILKWVKDNNFNKIIPYKDFFEIFYEDDGFEITISIENHKDNALVNVSVFGKRGKTRKKLISVLNELVKVFN